MNTSENNTLKDNKMGYMPEGKLLITMSLPMMISMLVQALYNIVDSIFVSRICEDALTAVSLAFPLQTLMIGMAVGLSVGMNAMLSKALGEQNTEKVNASATNTLFMTILNILFFIVLGLSVVRPFFAGQTDNEAIINYGTDYLTIICCMGAGLFFQIIFEKLLQSTGKTVLSMISQMTGAIVNLILDPILIFGLFSFPRLEVKGAAIATVAGQIIGACVGLVLNVLYNKEVSLNLKGFRPGWRVIMEIYKVGLPSIFMQCVGSVMTYGMNRILIVFTSTAVAVFGVYFKLQSFVFMPLFGLTSGLVPIVAFNYGARKCSRVLETIKIAILVAVAIMVAGAAAFAMFPSSILSLFDASEHMLSMGIPALRIICIHFPVAAVCIILSSTFQALGNGLYSLIVSLIRQIAVLLPAAYFLSLTGNVNAVWWAFPIAEIASLTVTLICFNWIKEDIIDQIEA